MSVRKQSEQVAQIQWKIFWESFQNCYRIGSLFLNNLELKWQPFKIKELLMTLQGFSEMIYIFMCWCASWPFLRTRIECRDRILIDYRDWQPARRVTTGLMSDLTHWLGLPADTETDLQWLTRTSRRRPDWPAVTRIDCPATLHTIFFKFSFVRNVWGMWGMGQRVQQYFHKCKKNFYRTFLTLCLIPHIPHTFKYNQNYYNFQLK